MADVATRPPRARGSATAATPRRPIALLVSAGLAVLLLVAAGSVFAMRGQGPPPSQSVFPQGSRLGGFALPSAIARGAVRAPWLTGQPSVVVFVASTCDGCMSVLHRAAVLAGTGDFHGVRFVGVDGDHSSLDAAPFLSRSGVRFPVGLDLFLRVSSRIVPQGEPATVFVRRDGVVAEVVYGAVSDVAMSAGLSAIEPGGS